MAAVTDTTILSHSTLFFRDLLVHPNVTDPKNATRSGNSQFVMTKWPDRQVEYPLITIIATNLSDESLGQSTENHKVSITYEVQVWARNTKERDELAEQVYDRLRSTQLDASTGHIANNLHDFRLLSSSQVTEEGKRGLKRWLFSIEADYYTGTG